jgi:Tfp pilus assembly ATPase PilU
MGLDAAIYNADERRLASVRLGNIAHVAFLRDLAVQSLGAQSLVAARVLYSGTHSGDSIRVTELQPLSRELQVLADSPQAEMQTFARELVELVRLASINETPIVFS